MSHHQNLFIETLVRLQTGIVENALNISRALKRLHSDRISLADLPRIREDGAFLNLETQQLEYRYKDYLTLLSDPDWVKNLGGHPCPHCRAQGGFWPGGEHCGNFMRCLLCFVGFWISPEGRRDANTDVMPGTKFREEHLQHLYIKTLAPGFRKSGG